MKPTEKPSHGQIIDLDSILSNFHIEYSSDSEVSISVAMSVLLDRSHTMARIGVCQKAMEWALENRPDEVTDSETIVRSAALIGEVGIHDAIESGKLSSLDVHQVLRDPEGLRLLFNAFNLVDGEPLEAEIETTTDSAADGPVTRLHLTKLAHVPGSDRTALRGKLEQILPWLIKYMQWSDYYDALANRLLENLSSVELPPDTRFRDIVRPRIIEFAATESLDAAKAEQLDEKAWKQVIMRACIASAKTDDNQFQAYIDQLLTMESLPIRPIRLSLIRPELDVGPNFESWHANLVDYVSQLYKSLESLAA